MKTVQKLEIFAGLATFALALIGSFTNFDLKVKNADTSIIGFLAGALLMAILPSFLVAVGSYTHAVKQSKLGLILLLTFGSIIVLFYGFSFLVGLLIGSKIDASALTGFLFISLAIATIIFALINVRRLSTQKNNLL